MEAAVDIIRDRHVAEGRRAGFIDRDTETFKTGRGVVRNLAAVPYHSDVRLHIDWDIAIVDTAHGAVFEIDDRTEPHIDIGFERAIDELDRVCHCSHGCRLHRCGEGESVECAAIARYGSQSP